jgi:hypothetical protein
MDRVRIIVAAFFLGVLYAYLTSHVIGIGAAIAIPASILYPVVKSYPTFAFAMVDLITVGFPLIILYILFALTVKYFNSSKNYFPYLALLAPLFFVIIYESVTIGKPQDWSHSLAIITSRYIGIAVLALLFAKRAENQTKA